MGDNEKPPRFTTLPGFNQRQTRRIGTIICWIFFIILIVAAVYYGLFHKDPEPDPISFLGEEQFKDPSPNEPVVKTLGSEPRVGELLHIYANITKSSNVSNDFCVSLAKSPEDQKNLPMKICAHFGNESRIIYTALWDGQLKANFSGPNPFTPGEKLDLRIRFLDKYLQVFAAQGEVGIFEKIPEVHKVQNLLVTGGVTGMRLIKKTGQLYPNPTIATLSLNQTDRMDLVMRPLAIFNSSTLWNDLIEGTNFTRPEHSRVKRRGSSGGRGGSGARGGGHGGGHSGGRSSFHSGGFHGSSSYHYHYTYSSCCYSSGWIAHSGSSNHNSHPARSTWGSYMYSPVFGGYYLLPSYNLTTANNTHIFTPASYSYRTDNETFYSPSNGHGKAFSNDSVVDHTKIPRPKRFDILFSKDSINPAFTMSFRFSEEAVILNTWSAGSWDEEERSPFIPIDDWRIVDLTIINDGNGLKIYLNRYPFVTYTHKVGYTDSLKYVRIDGDIEVLSLSRNEELKSPL